MFSLFRLVDVSWEGEGYALDALPISFSYAEAQAYFES